MLFYVVLSFYVILFLYVVLFLNIVLFLNVVMLRLDLDVTGTVVLYARLFRAEYSFALWRDGNFMVNEGSENLRSWCKIRLM